MSGGYPVNITYLCKDGTYSTPEQALTEQPSIGKIFREASEQCNKNGSPYYVVTSIEIHQPVRNNDQPLTFIAATNIETVDEKLSRLNEELDRLEDPANYREDYSPGEIKAILAKKREVESERNNGYDFYYTEPRTGRSRAMRDAPGLHVIALDGTILRLPNGETPQFKRGEPRPSMHNINPWAKNGLT